MMYIPHYDAILHAIGTSRTKLDGKSEVTIPVSLFKFLLQIAVLNSEFSQQGYVAANKDIQEALKRGQVRDPKLHYVGFGFFEGRRGATPPVDEAWYRRVYTDVAAAIRSGSIHSGSEHFIAIGAEEFRAPAAVYESDAAEWKRACRGQ